MSWKDFIDEVTKCDSCREYSGNPSPKRQPWNGYVPDDPAVKGFTRSPIFFLSEAPPGGKNAHSFFQNITSPDKLRDILLPHIGDATHFKGPGDFNLDNFYEKNCYLLPSFSYGCVDNDGSNGNPTFKAIEHSSKHLKLALDCLNPRKVVLLGRRALWMGLCLNMIEPKPEEVIRKARIQDYSDGNPHQWKAKGVLTYVTYWPTKRTPGGTSHLGSTLDDVFKVD